MASVQLLASIICLAAILASSSSVQPSEQEYTLYKAFQDALVTGKVDGVSNLYVLESNFFPAQDQPPICVPVNYILVCNGTANVSCLEDDGYSQNSSFLWSQYDLSQPIGALLLSYASSGIILKGFDWEDACIYSKPFRLNLTLTTNDQFDSNDVMSVLLDITSQVSSCGHDTIHPTPTSQ